MTRRKYIGAVATKGHDIVVNSLVDISRSCGIHSHNKPPSHRVCKHVGDMLIDRRVGMRSNIVGDVSITHPVGGSPTSPSQAHTIGLWHVPSRIDVRYNAKKSKHFQPYSSLDILFLPLVASTYGVLHPDFLRLLWMIAEKATSPADTGEIRGAQTPEDQASLRKCLFFKAKARVSCTVARAAAGRIMGYVGTGSNFPYSHSYYPTDPDFLVLNSPSFIQCGPAE